MAGEYNAMDMSEGSRMCGSRSEDSIYLEMKLGRGGEPIRSYILCEPKPIGQLKLADLGVTLIDRGGYCDVVDVVGFRAYDVPSFMEEMAHMGISRKLSPTMDYSKITRDSKLYIVHRHAIVENWEELGQACERSIVCPANAHTGHGIDHQGPCLACHYEIVEPCEDDIGFEDTDDLRRKHPSGFRYTVRPKPKGFEPKYSAGFITRGLPISGFAITEGPKENDGLIEAVSKSEVDYGITKG